MSRELQAIAVILLIVGLGWLGYGVLFGGPAGDQLVIMSVEGAVQRVDGFGTQAAAQPGQALEPRDRIVAGAGGKAVLSLGPDSRVTLEESSAVRVVSLDQAGVKLELEGGKVQATIHPGTGTVGIRADGREVQAEDADFTAARGDDGTLAIVDTRGQVALTGVDGATRLGPGEKMVAGAGAAALVGPASEELLLHVAWPESHRTREAAIEVHGETEPGATVRVGHEGAWHVVRADKAGAFVVQVPLSEGTNALSVEATSVLGNSVAVAQAVVRDTTAPNVGVEIHY